MAQDRERREGCASQSSRCLGQQHDRILEQADLPEGVALKLLCDVLDVDLGQPAGTQQRDLLVAPGVVVVLVAGSRRHFVLPQRTQPQVLDHRCRSALLAARRGWLMNNRPRHDLIVGIGARRRQGNFGKLGHFESLDTPVLVAP